jgi:hypothetical protein
MGSVYFNEVLGSRIPASTGACKHSDFGGFCQFLSSFKPLQLAPVIMLVRRHRQSTSVLNAPPLMFVQKIMFVKIPEFKVF